MSQQGFERHAALLRAWHLAILRCSLTRDNADRLGVLAIANEIDRLSQRHQTEPSFSFFRRTSAELCAAMQRQQKGAEDILNRYFAQVEDVRLHRALAAAFEIPQRRRGPTKRIKPSYDLWRGLPSRNNLNRL